MVILDEEATGPLVLAAADVEVGFRMPEPDASRAGSLVREGGRGLGSVLEFEDERVDDISGS